MALVRTTLTAPITAGQLTFGVANSALAGFPAVGAAPLTYQPVVIDDEVMFLVSVPQTNMITVRMRGSDGTEAAAHDTGSAVITSATPSDFPALQPGMSVLRPPTAQDIVTYATSGVLAVPTELSTVAFLAATAAGAFTLGAPSLALDGLILEITSRTAFAHVVTATGLFNTGGAGPFTTATFPAQIGASMMLQAQNGAWNVVNASITPVVFA